MVGRAHPTRLGRYGFTGSALTDQYLKMKSIVNRYWNRSRFPSTGSSNAAPICADSVSFSRPPIAHVSRFDPRDWDPKLIRSRPSAEIGLDVPFVVYWNQFNSVS